MFYLQIANVFILKLVIGLFVFRFKGSVRHVLMELEEDILPRQKIVPECLPSTYIALWKCRYH